MYPRRNSGIKSTLLPDGYLVLLNTKTDWAHTLNPSGALVWEFCDGAHNVQDIAAELAAGTQSADAMQLTTAVSDLVRQLVDENLLSLGETATRV